MTVQREEAAEPRWLLTEACSRLEELQLEGGEVTVGQRRSPGRLTTK